jgi:putrescine aminotransferase
MLGLMGALELVGEGNRRFDKSLNVGERCRDLCIEHGLVMRAVGDTMIIAPPLIITRVQIDELLEKVDRVLTHVAKLLV